MRSDDDFDSESYVKVNTRLMEFWQKNPEGRIETGYTFHEGVLVMEARIFRTSTDEKPSSTGHAFLERLDGEKVGEYTETVAVGRALALLGFRIEKSIATGEEMNRFKQRQDSKREEAPRESKIKPAAPKQEAAPAAPLPALKQETKPEAALQAPKEQRTVSDTPEVPKTLKAARVFKPRPKQDANVGGQGNG